MTQTKQTATKNLNKKELASLQMRSTIINTTIEILGTEGYAEVTASNLSKKAGISKGALYHHFANLDEIRLAALTLLIEQFAEVDDPTRYKDLQDFLETTGNMVLVMMQQYPVAIKALLVFVTRALVDDAIKEQIQILIKHALDQYQQVFHHFCPQLSDEELNRLVWIVDAYYTGSILQWHIMDDSSACRAGWQQFSKLIIQYIETKN